MALNNSENDAANIRATVKAGYDRVAPTFLTASFESSGNQSLAMRKLWIERLLSILPPKSHILELGCGAGIPGTRTILEGGHAVMATDISSTQIDLAKEHLRTFLSPSPSSTDPTPQLTLFCADMTTLNFPPCSFSAVVAFYSIPHLPEVDQQPMIRKVISWLKPGGLLLTNFFVMPGETFYDEWLGVKMFWGGLSAQANSEMIENAGESMSIIDSGVGEERFREVRTQVQWVLAIKDEREIE